MNHVVLLGDSVFDNAAYVAGGPDVRSQLQERLGTSWQVSLIAVDGDRAHNVAPQPQHLPPDASHLVVSVGGNDAWTISISSPPLPPPWPLLWKGWLASPRTLNVPITPWCRPSWAAPAHGSLYGILSALPRPYSATHGDHRLDGIQRRDHP